MHTKLSCDWFSGQPGKLLVHISQLGCKILEVQIRKGTESNTESTNQTDFLWQRKDELVSHCNTLHDNGDDDGYDDCGDDCGDDCVDDGGDDASDDDDDDRRRGGGISLQ